ncbi:hypothetical protein KIW84_031268 [Lathyrus oleraceus]|uniref:Uncharacterized protein n=1 Tax=Pisum sativum TaxID=3888 RepID=A0A9D4XRV1_PEA|nr:hypothetical protein KIW84_031268 [Pisum sativum]
MDIVFVDSTIIPVENRFTSAVICTGEGGNDITFWYSKWICNQPLWETYLELCVHAINTDCYVAETGLLAEFAGLLQQVSMEQNIPDRFVWMGDIKGVFSVKYCVKHFTDKKPSSMPSDIVISINHLWNVNVPPNFLIFGWRFLLNRIPAKD